jgi:hypothetical protein
VQLILEHKRHPIDALLLIPSKVGANWSLKGCGSTITTFNPPCAAARAKAAPVSPAPAMTMS